MTVAVVLAAAFAGWVVGVVTVAVVEARDARRRRQLVAERRIGYLGTGDEP